jgi:hypothetical protein
MDLVQVRERTRGERTLKHGKVRRKVEGGETGGAFFFYP